MNSAAKNLRLLGTPLSLMAAWVSNRLSNVLASDAWVWQAHDFTSALMFALACLWVFQLLPYSRPYIKALALALTLAGAVELAYLGIAYATGWHGYLWALCAQTAAILGALCAAWCKATDRAGGTVESSHYFLLRRRANSLQGICLYLLGHDAGYAIYCNGTVYRYRRGVFCGIPWHPTMHEMYWATQGPLVQERPELERRLRVMLGHRWRPWRNCLQLRGLLC